MLSTHTLQTNQHYSRRDLWDALNIPQDNRGMYWRKGLVRYENQFYIFANVGIPGTTGHDYDNYFLADEFHWQGEGRSRLHQPTFQALLHEQLPIHLLYREDAKKPFTYAGLVRPKSFEDTKPVRVVWTFKGIESQPFTLAEEVENKATYKEGATKTITVNGYERNTLARSKCIAHHGYDCSVCGFNFEKVYGDIGEKFIHVHHLRPIAEIKEEYVLDPINDLRPVCPNCHAMLHKPRPILSIDELKARLIAES